MKRFCDYLFEEAQQKKRLLEAVHVVQPNNGRMGLVDFGNLLNQVQNKPGSFVKVLKFINNDDIRVSNLRFEGNNVFDFQPNAGAPAFARYSEDYGDAQEASVELVYNDYTAMQQAANIEESTLSLRHLNRNQDEQFIVYYDDRLNLVFLCIDSTREQAEQFVNSLIALLQGMIENHNENTHVDGRYSQITQAIQHYSDSPIALTILNAMTSQNVIQQNADAQAIQQANRIDVVDVEPEQAEEAAEEANTEETNVEEPDEQAIQNTTQTAQQDERFVEIDGMRIRKVSDEDGISFNTLLSDQHDLIVSGEEFRNFISTLGEYGDSAIRAFAGTKPAHYKKIQWDNAVDPLRRLSFMRFTDTGNGVDVIFSCKKNAHKFIQKMGGLQRIFAQQIASQPASTWGRLFLREWVRQYNNYSIELLWDPDSIGRTLKHTGNRPDAQQAEQPNATQGNAQQDNAQQPQRQRRPRAGVTPPEQITQLETQAKRALTASGVNDVDMSLVLNRSGRTRGIPRDDNKYFVLKFPGVDPTVLVGDQAKTFLDELDLWTGIVKPAFDEIAEQVPELKLCITMNNRYYVPTR